MKIHTQLMANIKSHKITLKSKEMLASNTFSFAFTKPPGFQYRSGQHARLTILQANSDRHESLSRFLSFASAPHESDLTFTMRMSSSIFKQSLLKMKPGEQVLLQTRQRAHRHSFSWYNHPDANRPAVFIVGGIGVVPALSMIKDAIEQQLPTPIYLFYANRRLEEATYLADLESMSKIHPVLTFIPSMTKHSTSNRKWHGETGYICRNMVQAYLPDLLCPIYYIAGKSSMVRAMYHMVRDFGANKVNIRTEEFDSLKMQRLTDPTSWRRRVLNLKAISLGLLITIAVAAHLKIFVAVGHGDTYLPSFGFTNLGITIGLIVTAIGIKIAFVLYKRRGKP